MDELYSDRIRTITDPSHLRLLVVAVGHGWRPNGIYQNLNHLGHGADFFTDEDFRNERVAEDPEELIDALTRAQSLLSTSSGGRDNFSFRSTVNPNIVVRSTLQKVQGFIEYLEDFREQEVFIDWEG